MFADEGKNIVMGAVICYLTLTGYDVYCVCYSQLLSQMDQAYHRELFSSFQMPRAVNYGTFGEVTEKLLNSESFDLRREIHRILVGMGQNYTRSFIADIARSQEQPRKKVLLVDEVDAFFTKDFFGKYYAPSTSISSENIEGLARYVWNNRDDITYEMVLESREFESCSR